MIIHKKDSAVFEWPVNCLRTISFLPGRGRARTPAAQYAIYLNGLLYAALLNRTLGFHRFWMMSQNPCGY